MSGDPVVARRVRPYGDRAVMVDVDDVDAALSWAAAVRSAVADGSLAGVVDVVPGMQSVLVIGDGVVPRDTMADAVTRVSAPRDPLTDDESAAGQVASETSAAPEVRIPVRYDGPDLSDVAALTGMTEDAVVRAHTGSRWRVAFAGFMPGFGYLVGGDRRLTVSRRAESRPVVAAGSVGLAGEFSGVYPRSSPGGWQIIGHTDAVLWDVDRDPPAVFTPGVVVRFVDESADESVEESVDEGGS